MTDGIPPIQTSSLEFYGSLLTLVGAAIAGLDFLVGSERLRRVDDWMRRVASLLRAAPLDERERHRQRVWRRDMAFAYLRMLVVVLILLLVFAIGIWATEVLKERLPILQLVQLAILLLFAIPEILMFALVAHLVFNFMVIAVALVLQLLRVGLRTLLVVLDRAPGHTIGVVGFLIALTGAFLDFLAKMEAV